eukprot:TRINITY_DN30992_c0_g1_i1.p1 TRINITY_DN30992_c0_g1~~TRINITY_DN30992_c0_g1_i1.p1  ORF type:complete len:336 (-),score=51.71 TRINITY_DN30992_c0_g1_i1:71-1078(-)
MSDLEPDRHALDFLRSSNITVISPEIPAWPSGFMAAAPELLNSSLLFDGSCSQGWYKTGFHCSHLTDDQHVIEHLVAKFHISESLSTSNTRGGTAKGPFLKLDRGSNYDAPAWKGDHIAMLDDYRQQAILSMLSYIYALKTPDPGAKKIAYLLPVLVKTENGTHTWFGIVEKALPEFTKPTSWQKTDWEYKDLFMKFRQWCWLEHGIRLDDPQGLFCDGDWVYFTDGIIHCRNVEETYNRFKLILEDMDDEGSTLCPFSDRGSNDRSFEIASTTSTEHVCLDLDVRMAAQQQHRPPRSIPAILLLSQQPPLPPPSAPVCIMLDECCCSSLEPTSC